MTSRPDGDDPLATLLFLRRLRQAAGEGAALDWRAGEGAGLDWRVDLLAAGGRLLHHLPPPVSGPDASAVAAWRAAHRPGLCHYRRGPGFLLVSDARGGAAVTTTLAGEPAEVFTRYLDVGPAPAADPVFDRLVTLDLILPLGDLALTLPYRIRRWPIPCTSI